jgi:EAL domain-containing protein (putative c-di-GMP-specific phosphodiesterase class I)
VFHLARTLHIRTVAERVESDEQAAFVRPRCDALQGFVFARPMSAAQITAWLPVHGAGGVGAGIASTA